MPKLTYKYKAKCRGCDIKMQHTQVMFDPHRCIPRPNPDNGWKRFIDRVREIGIQVMCHNCDELTIHDLISYKEKPEE